MTEDQTKKFQRMTKRLFNNVTAQDILVWNSQNRTFQVGDKLLPANTSRSMVEQAKAIKAFDLWELLVKDMQFQANLRMYNQSQSYDDMIAGKWMLYTLHEMEKVLDRISKHSV